MGFDSRDYARDGDSGGWSGRGGLVVIPWIIGICVAVMVANAASPIVDERGTRLINDWLQLSLHKLWPDLQIWRLITYGFAHGGVWHIVFNMFALWLFGRYVEPIYGAREFLAFYLVAIVVSGFGFLVLDAGLSHSRGIPAELSAVGASGGVMAVTILTACHFPRERFIIYWFIPVQLWVLALVTVFIDLVGVLEGSMGVAHGAHLAGAAFGFLYYRYDWRVLRGLGRISLPGFRGLVRRVSRRSPPVRIYRPQEERAPADVVSEATVDRLLQKISEHGEASLTDDERATLAAASRQAASRRQRPQ